MAHRGIREWTGEELSSVALGQNGFHIIKGTTAVTAASKGITYWIALKAVDGPSEVEASSYGSGDDLSKTGVYGSGNWIDLADGDIVYGAFDAIDMNSATDFIVAYIGK
mgnify:CR=1 FL=1